MKERPAKSMYRPVTQQDIFRSMSPEQKLRAAERLFWSAWQLREARERELYPNRTEEEIRRTVRDYFLYARN